MPTLVPTRRSWLAPSPVVGSPARWAREGALYGGLLGFAAPAVPSTVMAIQNGRLAYLPAWFVSPEILTCVAAALVLGATLGLFQPALLDRVRGRVPLALVVLGEGLVGAAAGAATALAVCFEGWWVSGGPPPAEAWLVLAAIGATYAGFTTLACWLPFTVATVTGRRSWPVTVAAAVTMPSLLTLLVYLALA